MNRADHVGTREDEQIVITAQVLAVLCESCATEVCLGQPTALDHGAHGPVKDEDSSFEKFGQRVAHVHASSCLRFVAVEGFVPEAMSTVKGSPALLAPTPTLTSRNPAA